jgi:hypothetical protein
MTKPVELVFSRCTGCMSLGRQVRQNLEVALPRLLSACETLPGYLRLVVGYRHPADSSRVRLGG